MMLRLLGAAAALALTGAVATAAAQVGGPPSAERVRLAEQVVEAAGGGANMKAAMSKIFDAATVGVPYTGTADQQARFAQQQAFLKDRMTFYLPQIQAASAQVYAQEFDEAQLRDMLTFYRTPTGQALQAKLPQIAGETLQVMRPTLLKMQRDILEHACATTPCTDTQKAELAKLQAMAG